MKKIIISIIPALLLVIVIGYFIINKSQKYQQSNAINAIPQNTSFFVQVKDLPLFIKNLGQSKIWLGLIKNAFFDQLNDYYINAYKLISKYPKLKSILSENQSIIAVRRQGKTNVDFMLIVSFRSATNLTKFKRIIYQIISSNKLTVSTLEYNNFKILKLKADKQYYFAFSDGLFLFTPSYLFLQNALRQLASPSSLNNIEEFQLVAQNAGQTANATLFVNYKELQYALVNVLSRYGKIKLSKLERFANWSSLDINISQNYVRLLGYTSVDEKLNKFLRIFYQIEPAKFYVDKILPSSTVEYTVFAFESYEKFRENYFKYLTAKDLSSDYKFTLEQLKKNYNIQPDLDLANAFGKTITLAKVKPNALQNKAFKYMIISLKNPSRVKKEIITFIKNFVEVHNIENRFISINKEFNLNIYKLPDTLFFSHLFGQLADFPYQKYAFFLDNYLILTSDKEAVTFFLQSYKTQDFLIKRPDYKDFKQNITPKVNIFYYSHKPLTEQNMELVLNSKYYKRYRNNQIFFNALENFAAEFYFSEKSFITYLTINYNPKAAKSKVIWSRRLAQNINTKPFIFINHNTGEKEVFVGDDKGNIYLINNKGEILWTRNIGEPIMGNIYMIDYYQNHKYQLLFNTKNKIYIIDRKKRDVENFPITLPAPASASISVFDYEKDGNYRIFVPCENNKVYLYTKKGKINPQWLITQTTAPVTYPVQHFVYKGKDYIVFADDVHIFILDRKGRVRIPVEKNIAKAPYTGFYFMPKDKKHKREFFITTTRTGKLAFISLLGELYLFNTPKTFSANHRFVMTDLNADNNYEFIFADDDQIFIYEEYGNTVKLKSDFKTQGDIVSDIVLYNFGHGNINLGVQTDQNLIYLINNKGILLNGFPRKGSTPFTITRLIPQQPFYVIVGNKQYLTCYQL